jgi:hypothetical protein
MTRAGQADIPGRRKARKIEGQYIAHRLAMIESPAYRVLSFHARRCLDRIEIEHLRHGGKENGRLPVTYDQFIEYGVMSRRFIGPALRELVAPVLDKGGLDPVQRRREPVRWQRGAATISKPYYAGHRSAARDW